ncbi:MULTISPECIES: Ku protein [Dyella]|uniref:Non-homologous end joining protein Ku n=2 Tax=Dyella TaxID=231454 RepID=A0A4R0Z178_9GAMM|nr:MULTISPECIES: Ku protein [Dyella]TBR39499.1 Ku protein [Dyella terrae]TCI12916.1 Ku protein [Dyella soli]
MPRPLWNGSLSFGLLNVPVSLMPGERKVDLHFRMLDSRNKAPVRYERVNAETGEEVPWKDVVRAYEYKKGSYVVLEPEDIQAARSDSKETVEIEAFVDAASLSPEFYEKPYVLVPNKKAEKGYVLLRETLKKTHRVGIARVVVRSREYLAAVVPKEHALLLLLLRYPQEVVDAEEYALPDAAPAKYRISAKEMEMARQLLESMTTTWNPSDYQDEFRDRLRKTIEKRIKSKGAVTPPPEIAEGDDEGAATNVVDFMKLLQKSLSENRRTPAERKSPAKKANAKKAAARKTAAKRTATGKATRKRARR